MAARYSLGVDLGTSNSVLAYAPLGADAPAEALDIPQYETTASVIEAPTLPSFLYLPEAALAADIGADWIVGRLAQRKASEAPGRVISSAKSWLCHDMADRTAPFLPWGSDALTAAQKISPLAASAKILSALRAAWNARFPGDPFDAQAITLTVPASFDAAAQRLTLDAAREAGFPADTSLLEEPQAAFYAWLERHADNAGLRGRVLVVDIGGGTSDFSLFEIDAGAAIRRVAVSDHILLGGDNIDLALAHLIEPRLVKDGAALSPGQWDHLVARCRALKEDALGGEGPGEEVFTVSIPGRGSRLIAQSLSAQATRAELEALVLDGFFPDVAATDAPRRAAGAIKEFGLPYAFDSAATRHLAAFLAGRGEVDAVLFNGGTLRSPRLRARIADQIARWQAGRAPRVLEAAHLDLAVATGAAHAGRLRARKARRIDAGAARALFMEAQDEGATHKLVCVLPQGAAPEQVFALDGLSLRVGRLVRFQLYASGRHEGARPGDVVALAGEALHALPPLETMADLETPDTGLDSIPIQLTARVNELGLLQLACRSLAPDVEQTWPLEFNLRAAARAAEPPPPSVDPAAREAAGRQIAAAISKPLGKRDKLTAPRLLQTLETTLARPRGEWSAPLLRDLWTPLLASAGGRRLSVEHEETWLILAGFLLRPGFGVALDAQRIDALWDALAPGSPFPGKRTKLQEYIVWRRVAGGLSAARQEDLLAREAGRAETGERVRMAGAFERLSLETKGALIDRFLAAVLTLAEEKQHCAPYLTALGLLMNRTPFYAGPETVVSPAYVERAFEALRRLDWTAPEFVETQTLFLRAARALDDRRLDPPRALRQAIADKLQKCGAPQNRIDRVRSFAPVERVERLSLYGEALPPGLVLTG